jgi:hypothetical protein
MRVDIAVWLIAYGLIWAYGVWRASAIVLPIRIFTSLRDSQLRNEKTLRSTKHIKICYSGTLIPRP